jgi:hypothetical protein
LEDTTTAAPAPLETPAPVVTAAESAVAKDDFTAYRETRRAERAGTPAPAPAAAPVVETPPDAPAAPVEEPRQVSKRQQDINERIRVATERAVAAKDAEIARLRSQLPPPPAAARTEPAAETFPTYAEYLETHPDASLEKYIDARQDFREDVKARATAAQRTQAEQHQSAQAELAKSRERTDALRKADPIIDARFKAWEAGTEPVPALFTIPTRAAVIAHAHAHGVDPMSLLRPEHDLATEIGTSEYGPQIVLYLTDHPDVMQEIGTLPDRRAVARFIDKLEMRFESSGAPAPVPVPKTISSAPTPGTSLGSRPASAVDPVEAAVAAGDVSAFRAAKRAALSVRR